MKTKTQHKFLTNIKTPNQWWKFGLYILGSIVIAYLLFIVLNSILILISLIVDKTLKLTFLEAFNKTFKSPFFVPKANIALYISLGALLFLIIRSFNICFFKKQKNRDHVTKTDNIEYGSGKWLLDERKPEKINLKDFEKVYTPNFEIPSYLTRTTYTNKNGKHKLLYHGISVRDVVHQIIIGSTGSGKTQKVIFPTIFTNSRLKDIVDPTTGIKTNRKPSFVITDPKGEIFDVTKMDLEKQGYNVQVLNFKDPSKSMGWNPLAQTLKFFTIAITYEKDFIQAIKKSSKQDNAKINHDFSCLKDTIPNCTKCYDDFKNNKKQKKFWIDKFDKKIIYTQEDYDKYLTSQIKYFKSLAQQEIVDLAETLINSSSSKEDIWPNGAKSLIKGVLMAMLEIKEKDFAAITEKNFNMVTVQKILANRTSLNNWFKKYGYLNPTSGSWGTCSAQIDCGENTNSSYFSAVSNGTRIFADESLQDILCKNDINLFEIASKDKPTALFLIVPDQRKDKHPLASLFVSQLYLACSFVADRNRIDFGREELDRDLMFLLDEFGNMPAIANFDTILSVSRSRRIFFTLIVQDLAQIDKEYDRGATTIKSNCLLTVYLKSDNENINEMIAKKCGKETVLTRSVSDDNSQSSKSSTSMVGKDLITAADLFKLTNSDDELAVVLYAGMQPAITRFKHLYKLKKLGVMNFFGKLQFDSTPNPIMYDESYFFDLSNYKFQKDDVEPIVDPTNLSRVSKEFERPMFKRPKPNFDINNLKLMEFNSLSASEKQKKIEDLKLLLKTQKLSTYPDENQINGLKKDIELYENSFNGMK
ncbi:conjugation protein [Williamsoniiplasma luminosum]|uniref:Conjugation protein n=1 Tax=Williamsoniiplasma luminosum TaxID=214888 RepID=A0A2K8NTZ6_9MOLU|nr:type IV secretory system conjugative DNA transfer family protein [Williamsoniiplasma luminosum]ATZ17237.1 conjugation protein [Williamsoniiplasma luminosum]